jgi:hypothetical protein
VGGNPVNFIDPNGQIAVQVTRTLSTPVGVGIGISFGCILNPDLCRTIVTLACEDVSNSFNDFFGSYFNEEADKNRQKARDKGIPDSVLGPSGKPKIHNVDHPNKKSAKDAAKNDGQGSPMHHPSPTVGKPHYHPTDSSGNKKPGVHHNY